MGNLSSILDFNRQFVKTGEYSDYFSKKYPEKNLAILGCMDARMMELLHRSMGLKNGDAKIIKNAGALVLHLWGSVMLSLLLGVYDLNVKEIMVVAHHDCGGRSLSSEHMLKRALELGIPERRLEILSSAGIDLHKWFQGFENVEESVKHSTELIRNHPLMPSHILVHGLVIHPTTGHLNVIVDGRKDTVEKDTDIESKFA